MASEILQNPVANCEDVMREISKIKDIVSDAVEDGVKSAVRAMKQGREAAEDAIHDARRAVKQNPLQAVGVVFAAGVLVGSLIAWMGSRRR
ncbi:MAG TPA: DUF883 C-terminal domain-containing protein [Terracidiphilus sp.]|nr:DUF883 C-terminal domain-containing protein [Terracidiphilus sp.]